MRKDSHALAAGGLGAALVAALVAAPLAAATASATDVPPGDPQGGPVQFMPPRTTLSQADPADVGLDPAPIEAAVAQVRAHEVPEPDGTYAMYPGAVGLMGYEGHVVRTDASGYAVAFGDEGVPLPEDQRVPTAEDTIFDMASVTKLFTSIAVVQLVEEGRVTLDEPVATYLPEFAAGGKQDVTVRHLLTHTSGFVAWVPLWSRYPDEQSRIAAVMAQPLDDPAGTVYRYSDLNLITLGVLVEELRGAPLDEVVAERITGPLGMSDTGFNPTQVDRTAATEYQASPPRGAVRGEVHDENAWSLGGVAGHAGIFSTAHDMAVLSQALLNGGSYAKQRILDKRSVELMITNFTTAFPGDEHGLGFELDQRWYMDAMSGPRTAGHTGYTGTSLVIDFDAHAFAILLTNRVHPSRDSGSNNIARREWARGLAYAQGVEPRRGADAWFSGDTNATTSTLTTALQVPADGARLRFDLYLDTEESDPLHLETSADGGETWDPLPFVVRDRGSMTEHDGAVAGSGTRRWTQVRADLPPGDLLLRWRTTTDPAYLGRGVFVDGVVARTGSGTLLDGERTPDAFDAESWRLVER
ncbi:serine hydrolase domain-containing protein [Isoptericola cucumis]|uniref:Serine hydrolase n=1 Tax=Isoptericola cucumis TaxID=1776856 RepID=A0ABQ2B3L6_9MICO|nr:serine hydrolase domain-containing protein [Isoptericola cucumis]GGI06980.1 serine hydrolase [Isoptericola cucumis]